MRFYLFLSTGWLLLLATPAFSGGAGDGDSDVNAKADEKLLMQAGLPTDTAALLKFLEARSFSAADEAEMLALVQQLGAKVYADRVKAAARLVAIGPKARVILKRFLHNEDLEIVLRVKQCLKKIPAGQEAVQSAAVVRLLGHRQAADAAPVLLNYLPFVEDEETIDEVRAALAKVAVRQGEADAALLKALTSDRAVTRAAAAEALCRAGAKDHLAAIVPLLKDADLACRLQVALALLRLRQREAVPVLIGLLTEVPTDDLWRIEDTLLLLAGETAPALVKPAAPAKSREAWMLWWNVHGPKVDLAKVVFDETGNSWTAICGLGTTAKETGKVLLLGPDRKVRHEIACGGLPICVHLSGPNRFLVGDNRDLTISERDFTGKILWEKKLPTAPVSCQRLPSGKKIIATRSSVVVWDAGGQEETIFSGALTVQGAFLLRDGQYVVRTKTAIAWYKPGGTLLRQFAIPSTTTAFGGVQVLPNQNVLIAQYSKNVVAEYDTTGKVVWQVTVKSPTSAWRLPTGNTLVSSLTDSRVIEFNPGQQEVWSLATSFRPYGVHRK
jgi:hypothetical protein